MRTEKEAIASFFYGTGAGPSEIPKKKIFGKAEELPKHIIGKKQGIRRRRDGVNVGETLPARQSEPARYVEVVGDDRGRRIRRGHKSHAVLDILDSIESPVLDDDAVLGDSGFHEVVFHSLPFGEWLCGAFSACHDTDSGIVFLQILSGRVEAVLQDSAWAVFADLGAQNDQVVETGRCAAAETAQNKSLTYCEHKDACADGYKEKGSQYFGKFFEKVVMNQKSEQQKECAQREPDDKKSRAAADHEDHDSVQDA